jgi:hypothetical protein
MDSADLIRELLKEYGRGALVVAASIGLGLLLGFDKLGDLPTWGRLVIVGFDVALFVFGIYWMFRETGSKRIPHKWCDLMKTVDCKPNDRCEVFLEISPSEYSRLTKKVAEDEEINHIFTVMKMEPIFFVERIAEIMGVTSAPGQSLVTTLLTRAEADILKAADSEFPHFGQFRSFAAKRGVANIERVIIATSGGWESRNREALEFFKRLNGNIPCYVVSASVFHNHQDHVVFLTDHVVFDSGICFDYYDDSQTLILTCAGKQPLPAAFHKLGVHFNEKKDQPTVYSRLV